MSYIPKVVDLNLSSHTITTQNFTFVFSSDFNKERFIKQLHNNRTQMTYTITSRYNIPIQMDDYCDIYLYSKVEHRGFRILCNESGREIVWQKEVTFVGELKIQETPTK